MIISTIVMISGSFGNFILPIAIGARDMAFPRLNALSYWLFFTVMPVLLSTLVIGGFPTGWTGYAPLADQAQVGMDAYSFTIIVFALSVSVSGMNIVTTIATLRTKGMTMGRMPIFVWGTWAIRSAWAHRLPHIHACPGLRRHRPDVQHFLLYSGPRRQQLAL